MALSYGFTIIYLTMTLILDFQCLQLIILYYKLYCDVNVHKSFPNCLFP